MPMEILAWRFCLLALGRQLPRNCERLVNASLQFVLSASLALLFRSASTSPQNACAMPTPKAVRDFSLS